MGFMIPCPNCGLRDVYEYKFGGEAKEEPEPKADLRTWRHYIYFNKNIVGCQDEWWYHTSCHTWLKVKRDTSDNEILEVIPF